MEEKGLMIPEPVGQRIDIISEWLAQFGAAKENTLRAYGASVFFRASPLLQNFDHPGRVRLSDAEIILRRLREHHYKPATVNQTVSALSSLWKHFQRLGIVRDNPWVHVGRETPRDRINERHLTQDEVRRLIKAAPPGRARTLLLFMYATACRVSEAVRPAGTPDNSPRGLRWRDLRFEANGWGYATFYGKGGKTRTVGVRPEMVKILRKMTPSPSPDDAVFPMTRQTAFYIIKDCARRAGIKKRPSPHWLRHSHAVHALEHGAPINLVQATLGHARLDTTGIYLKVRPGKGTGEYL